MGWRKDARQRLSQSQVFLTTALWEGLPRALVEAFAESKPVVAYAVDGVKDLLVNGETGFAIEPGDVTKAAESILVLKNNPVDARRMGVAARQRVTQEFDIDHMVRQQEALYEKLYADVPLRTYYEPIWDGRRGHG